jgi:hypothetical protein
MYVYVWTYVCVGPYQHLHLDHHHLCFLRVWVQWNLGQVHGGVLGELDLAVWDQVTFRGLQNNSPLLNEMHASSSGCATVARLTLEPESPADLCRLSRGNSARHSAVDEPFGYLRAKKQTIWCIIHWITFWTLRVLLLLLLLLLLLYIPQNYVT